MQASAYTACVCPCCTSSALAPLASAPAAVSCTVCGCGIELDLPEAPGDAYALEAYDAERRRVGGVGVFARARHDYAVAVSRYAQLAPHLGTPAANALWADFGCGNGMFAAYVRSRGYRVVGVEADPSFALRVADFALIPVDTSLKFLACTNTCRVISLFDVLEHVIDPGGLIGELSRKLRHGASLVLEVPDFEGVTPTAFVTWKHRKRTTKFVEHVHHFTSAALKAAVAANAPILRLVHEARPVHGKLQQVWSAVG